MIHVHLCEGIGSVSPSKYKKTLETYNFLRPERPWLLGEAVSPKEEEEEEFVEMVHDMWPRLFCSIWGTSLKPRG